MWQTPVTDRTNNDTLVARAGQSTIAENKGALNYQDLNRIEGNHKELMQWLESGGYYIPHAYRNYTETFDGATYTDWQEVNIPWQSEINRIRSNYNYLVNQFLVNLDLPTFSDSTYLDWQEVNDWERIAEVGKTTIESMQQEYIICGTINSGGDILL